MNTRNTILEELFLGRVDESSNLPSEYMRNLPKKIKSMISKEFDLNKVEFKECKKFSTKDVGVGGVLVFGKNSELMYYIKYYQYSGSVYVYTPDGEEFKTYSTTSPIDKLIASGNKSFFFMKNRYDDSIGDELTTLRSYRDRNAYYNTQNEVLTDTIYNIISKYGFKYGDITLGDDSRISGGVASIKYFKSLLWWRIILQDDGRIVPSYVNSVDEVLTQAVENGKMKDFIESVELLSNVYRELSNDKKLKLEIKKYNAFLKSGGVPKTMP